MKIYLQVQNAPGEDICVIMCGYQEQIEKMFLDQNPGLQRRFPIASAFQFEDFSDHELQLIMVQSLFKGIYLLRFHSF